MAKKLFDRERAVSWSQLSSWEWSKEQWYKTYILGIRTSSPELEFGSMVDKRIQTDKSFLPTLKRYPLEQHKMTAKLGDIPLVGLPDGLDLDNPELGDYKTGRNPWTHKKAEETGQLTMYLLLLFLTEKLKPERFKCAIHWLPTMKDEKGIITFRDDPVEPVTFETSRTMSDILNFSAYIKKTVKDMESYALNYKPNSMLR